MTLENFPNPPKTQTLTGANVSDCHTITVQGGDHAIPLKQLFRTCPGSAPEVRFPIPIAQFNAKVAVLGATGLPILWHACQHGLDLGQSFAREAGEQVSIGGSLCIGLDGCDHVIVTSYFDAEAGGLDLDKESVVGRCDRTGDGFAERSGEGMPPLTLAPAEIMHGERHGAGLG